MSRNMIVPRPENSKVVLTGNPVSVGTSSVAPNMAITCCIPMPIVRPQLRRSRGATTAPGSIFLPSPWTVHPQVEVTNVHYLRPRPLLGNRGALCTQIVITRSGQFAPPLIPGVSVLTGWFFLSGWLFGNLVTVNYELFQLTGQLRGDAHIDEGSILGVLL